MPKQTKTRKRAAPSKPNSKAGGESELCFLSFPLDALLARVRLDFPLLADRRVEVWLLRQPNLACINVHGDAHQIRIHAVFNHPDTPEEVIAFVLQHELLHLQIPPREVDGKRVSHPPEFWEAERAMAKNRELAWSWICLTLHSVLKRDEAEERTLVKPGWRKRMAGKRLIL